MALTGLPVPAAEAEIPLFDNVFADIGDEQSIEQNLSTFSSHITRIVHILRNATPNSLVLLDELGAGTDPAEGTALGQAILELLIKTGIPTIVTTHIAALKRLAFSDSRAQNASVEFDLKTLKPTYHLLIGVAGESNAFKIAEKLGMPEEIIERSNNLFSETKASEAELFKELQELRRRLELDGKAARKLKQEAENARAEAKELAKEWKIKVEEMDSMKNAASVLPWSVGDEVYVKALRANGKVVRISRKGMAVVEVRGRNVTLPAADLERQRCP